MVIVEEYEEKINNKKLVELIESETYYELDFMTEDWIIRKLYICKTWINLNFFRKMTKR